jgi:hypothetical protein
MWTALLGPLAAFGKQWLGNRQEKAQAKHLRELSRIEADNTIAGNLTQGIKDELWTLTFIVPIWVGMYAVLAGDDTMLERLSALPAILTDWIPQWAWALGVVVSVVVSFGGRATDVIDRMGWGDKKNG